MKNPFISRFVPIIALMLFVGSSDLFAQGRGGRQNVDPEKALAEQLKVLTKGIDLTDEQVALVTPILQNTIKKQGELRESVRGGNVDRRAMRGKIDELIKSQNAQMAEILSEEQMKKYKEWQKEQLNNRRRGRRGNRSSRF